MKNKLGQNFLIDINTAKREVEYAHINKNDIVLEIGPGTGILTKLIAEKAKKVIAVEIDKYLVENLKEKIPENVELLHTDILKIDFERLSNFNKIVSNIPYQISSPLTFKLLDYDFDLAVLIYQKEFAERMIATPGTKQYSRLTVNIFYKALCEFLEDIPKNYFKPQPKVDSAIIKIKPRINPPFDVLDEKFFFNLVNILFSHRRKKIKTILKKYYNINLENILFKDERVERMKPEEIGELSNLIYNKIDK
jgi:16S rRNA (adenine1518-N6/adenine1519-N6)-dimethyltransferase